MATIRIGDREIEVPDIEVLAAFRMSYKTAVREGFPRTAAQVRGYLDELEDMDDSARIAAREAWEAGR